MTDTTYVWTDQGWHYLATVMNLFSREIIGWAFSSSNDRHLVCKALRLQSSMSAKGYCYDNAHMESFFGSLKSECQTLETLLSPQAIKLALFDYIEGF